MCQQIYQECCSWLSTSTFPSTLKLTNIALVSRRDVQNSMIDWKPIALSNMMYKLVAKVLANRLKCVRDKYISDNQFAFVPNGFIFDNVMSMIEIVHFMK